MRTNTKKIIDNSNGHLTGQILPVSDERLWRI